MVSEYGSEHTGDDDVCKMYFFAHLQGLKNPVLKLLSLQTQNFALKQTHTFSTDQTYVIIISCSKEGRHSKCCLPLPR